MITMSPPIAPYETLYENRWFGMAATCCAGRR
jgi:hypothetical protein